MSAEPTTTVATANPLRDDEDADDDEEVAEAVVPEVDAEIAAYDDESVAAAAAAVAIPTTQQQQQQQHNKWSKNGYGASVNKQTGKFSKEESEAVKSAVEDYCNAKQISVSRLCSECDHKAELKGAWMEIAKRLPHRSVQSVYRHGIRQCHPFKRGAWSAGECELLNDLVTRMGKKWSAIQAKLNRSADSCRDKYREMSDDYVKGRWKDEETAQLKRYIREHLHTQTNGATDAIHDMKELGKLVEEESISIPWSLISKKMGKRSRLSCFKKWQKMTGLYSAADATAGILPPPATTTTQQHNVNLSSPPDAKRTRYDEASTAGAAAAAAMGKTSSTVAELAAETVEALELPDTEALAGAAVKDEV